MGLDASRIQMSVRLDRDDKKIAAAQGPRR